MQRDDQNHALTQVLAELARLRAEVAALARITGRVYDAGRDDALGGQPAKPPRKRKRPPDDRTHLYVVRALIIACLGVAVLMAGPAPVFSSGRGGRSAWGQVHVPRPETRPPGRGWQHYHFVASRDQCPANWKLQRCEARRAEAFMAAEEVGLCAGPGQLPDLGEPRVEGVEAREKQGESALGVVGNGGFDLLAFSGECSQLTRQPRQGGKTPGRAGGVVQALHNAGRYVPVEQSHGAAHPVGAAGVEAPVTRLHAQRLRRPSCRVGGQHPQAAAACAARRYAGQQVLACVVPRRQPGAAFNHRPRHLPFVPREDGIPRCG